MPADLPTVWLDADGAPGAVKEVLFRAAERGRLRLVVVANRPLRTPSSSNVRLVQVSRGLDVADEHIAEACQPGDLVITSDVPLAAIVVERGATVLQFRGEPLTAENVRERLSVRDFMDEMRGGGAMTGGPAAYSPKDKQRFANALDRWVTARR